jgi:hypothetical protein
MDGGEDRSSGSAAARRERCAPAGAERSSYASVAIQVATAGQWTGIATKVTTLPF